jgi:ribosomal protein S18 acetylase RimI-like enzyme
LHELITEANRRGLGLCLSVRSENPACQLYERLGLRIVEGSAVRNRRTGGISLEMILECG